MKEFDIFLPLYHNDGTEVDARRFKNLRVRLLEFFDGLTFFPQPAEGSWRLGTVVFRDEIVIFRVVTTKDRAARKMLRQLKEELKRIFLQDEILIIERDVRTL